MFLFHRFVSADHYEFIKILLSHGANVNAMNNDFEYPIHLAALSG